VVAPLVMLAVVLLAGCSATGADEPTRAGNQAGYVGAEKSVTIIPPNERDAAPAISGAVLGQEGKEISTADLTGKVVVLNVWGSWCAPCRAEAPHMAKVAKETRSKGVQFVGINTRDLDKANAKAFERSYGIDYPSLYDPSGKQILKFPENSLSPQTIPSTLVLDRNGKIAVRALKELGEDDLRAMLEPVMAEK
jgi:thiol-disulfide isomerase/thioredoxin